MKHRWNEALAAYDQELPLLRALRDEYLSYVRERLEAAHRALPVSLAERVNFEIAKPGEDDAGAEMSPRSEAAVGTLQVQFWSCADAGDEPGGYAWAMLMATTLAPEFGDQRVALAVAREASAAVTTRALESAPAQARSYSGFDLVRWGRLDIAAADFDRRMAEAAAAVALGLCDAVDAVLSLRASTPSGWASTLVKQAHVEGWFLANGATESRHNRWRLGPFVTARVSPSDYCWFTACGDGRIALHWEDKDNATHRREHLPAALGCRAGWREQRYDGVVLIDAEELVQFHRQGHIQAVRERLLAAWRVYREHPPGASAGSRGAT